MKKIIKIDGMTCNHCKMSVEEALKNINGVKEVIVNLEHKTAEIIFEVNEITDENIKNIIEDIGFEVNSIKTI